MLFRINAENPNMQEYIESVIQKNVMYDKLRDVVNCHTNGAPCMM